MAIRRLCETEAEKASLLHGQVFDAGWPVSDFQIHIQNDTCLGYFEGVSMRGLMILRAVVPQAEVLTLAVDPSLRRQGVGQALMAAGETAAKAQGNQVIFLEVAEDNAAAIMLYQRLGYVPFGRRPGYYKRPNGRVAALNFSKKLCESSN